MTNATTEDEALTIIQPIFARICDKRKGNDLESFLMNLNLAERSLYTIGILNQQVENGGFNQWRENGYDVAPQFLKSALRVLGKQSLKHFYWEICRDD